MLTLVEAKEKILKIKECTRCGSRNLRYELNPKGTSHTSKGDFHHESFEAICNDCGQTEATEQIS